VNDIQSRIFDGAKRILKTSKSVTPSSAAAASAVLEMGGLVTRCRQPQHSRVDDVSATTVGARALVTEGAHRNDAFLRCLPTACCLPLTQVIGHDGGSEQRHALRVACRCHSPNKKIAEKFRFHQKEITRHCCSCVRA
jgi:hypothetical protein